MENAEGQEESFGKFKPSTIFNYLKYGIYPQAREGVSMQRAKALFIKDKQVDLPYRSKSGEGMIYFYDHMHCTYYTVLRVVYMCFLYGAYCASLMYSNYYYYYY